MKYSRSEAREKIMIILYQCYLYRKDNIEYNLNDVIKENVTIQDDFVNDMVNSVLEKENDIDKLINKYMKDWTIKRLGNVDQAIFRMSTYELVYGETPSVVSINEGIELAKKYSDEKVVKLLNGVLDSIYENEVTHE